MADRQTMLADDDGQGPVARPGTVSEVTLMPKPVFHADRYGGRTSNIVPWPTSRLGRNRLRGPGTIPAAVGCPQLAYGYNRGRPAPWPNALTAIRIARRSTANKRLVASGSRTGRPPGRPLSVSYGPQQPYPHASGAQYEPEGWRNGGAGPMRTCNPIPHRCPPISKPGLDGIEAGLDPGDPIDEDIVNSLPEDRRAALG